MSTEPTFDLESVYDSEIAPLMTQIIEICKRHGMPMLASFCYANDPNGTGETRCCTTNIPRFPETSDEWHPANLERACIQTRRNPTQAFAVTVVKK